MWRDLGFTCLWIHQYREVAGSLITAIHHKLGLCCFSSTSSPPCNSVHSPYSLRKCHLATCVHLSSVLYCLPDRSTCNLDATCNSCHLLSFIIVALVAAVGADLLSIVSATTSNSCFFSLPSLCQPLLSIRPSTFQAYRSSGRTRPKMLVYTWKRACQQWSDQRRRAKKEIDSWISWTMPNLLKILLLLHDRGRRRAAKQVNIDCIWTGWRRNYPHQVQCKKFITDHLWRLK